MYETQILNIENTENKIQITGILYNKKAGNRYLAYSVESFPQNYGIVAGT